jgi:hypothetical protein
VQRKVNTLTDWLVTGISRTPTGREFLIRLGDGQYTALDIDQALITIENKLRDAGIPPELLSIFIDATER